MRMYFFDVTFRVEHEGRSRDAVAYKGIRAPDEHQARRAVLDRYLDRGFQVVRLVRVREWTPRSDG